MADLSEGELEDGEVLSSEEEDEGTVKRSSKGRSGRGRPGNEANFKDEKTTSKKEVKGTPPTPKSSQQEDSKRDSRPAEDTPTRSKERREGDDHHQDLSDGEIYSDDEEAAYYPQRVRRHSSRDRSRSHSPAGRNRRDRSRSRSRSRSPSYHRRSSPERGVSRKRERSRSREWRRSPRYRARSSDDERERSSDDQECSKRERDGHSREYGARYHGGRRDRGNDSDDSFHGSSYHGNRGTRGRRFGGYSQTHTYNNRGSKFNRGGRGGNYGGYTNYQVASSNSDRNKGVNDDVDVIARLQKGLSLLPPPREPQCGNLDQFNYPAPPSWYLQELEEWEKKETAKTAAMATVTGNMGIDTAGNLPNQVAGIPPQSTVTGTPQGMGVAVGSVPQVAISTDPRATGAVMAQALSVVTQQVPLGGPAPQAAIGTAPNAMGTSIAAVGFVPGASASVPQTIGAPPGVGHAPQAIVGASQAIPQALGIPSAIVGVSQTPQALVGAPQAVVGVPQAPQAMPQALQAMVGAPPAPQAMVGAPQTLQAVVGAPQAPQAMVGSPQAVVGVPQAPQAVVGTPQAPQAMPQVPQAMPQAPQAMPQAPQGMVGAPQAVVGAPQAPQAMPQAPQGMVGAPQAHQAVVGALQASATPITAGGLHTLAPNTPSQQVTSLLGPIPAQLPQGTSLLGPPPNMVMSNRTADSALSGPAIGGVPPVASAKNNVGVAEAPQESCGEEDMDVCPLSPAAVETSPKLSSMTSVDQNVNAACSASPELVSSTSSVAGEVGVATGSEVGVVSSEGSKPGEKAQVNAQEQLIKLSEITRVKVYVAPVTATPRQETTPPQETQPTSLAPQATPTQPSISIETTPTVFQHTPDAGPSQNLTSAPLSDQTTPITAIPEVIEVTGDVVEVKRVTNEAVSTPTNPIVIEDDVAYGLRSKSKPKRGRGGVKRTGPARGKPPSDSDAEISYDDYLDQLVDEEEEEPETVDSTSDLSQALSDCFPTVLGDTPTVLGGTPTVLGGTPTVLGDTPTLDQQLGGDFPTLGNTPSLDQQLSGDFPVINGARHKPGDSDTLQSLVGVALGSKMSKAPGGKRKSARRKQKQIEWFTKQREKEAKQKLQEQQKALNKPQKIPCKYYLNGFCKNGANCEFGHEGPAQKRKEVCKFYLSDSCTKGEDCIYYHSDFPCKFFHTKSFCKNGDGCKFSHSPLTPLGRDLLLAAGDPTITADNLVVSIPKDLKEQDPLTVSIPLAKLEDRFRLKFFSIPKIKPPSAAQPPPTYAPQPRPLADAHAPPHGPPQSLPGRDVGPGFPGAVPLFPSGNQPGPPPAHFVTPQGPPLEGVNAPPPSLQAPLPMGVPPPPTPPLGDGSSRKVLLPTPPVAMKVSPEDFKKMRPMEYWERPDLPSGEDESVVPSSTLALAPPTGGIPSSGPVVEQFGATPPGTTPQHKDNQPGGYVPPGGPYRHPPPTHGHPPPHNSPRYDAHSHSSPNLGMEPNQTGSRMESRLQPLSSTRLDPRQSRENEGGTGHMMGGPNHMTGGPGHMTRPPSHMTGGFGRGGAPGHMTRAPGYMIGGPGHVTRAPSHVTGSGGQWNANLQSGEHPQSTPYQTDHRATPYQTHPGPPHATPTSRTPDQQHFAPHDKPHPPTSSSSPRWGIADGRSPEHGSPISHHGGGGALRDADSNRRRVDPRVKYSHLKIKSKGSSSPIQASSLPDPKQGDSTSSSSSFKIPKLLQDGAGLEKPMDPRDLFKGVDGGYDDAPTSFGMFKSNFFSGRSQQQSVKEDTKQVFGEITLSKDSIRSQNKDEGGDGGKVEKMDESTSASDEKKEDEDILSKPQVPSYLAQLGVGLGGSDLQIDSAFGSLGGSEGDGETSGGASKQGEESQARKLPSMMW